MKSKVFFWLAKIWKIIMLGLLLVTLGCSEEEPEVSPAEVASLKDDGGLGEFTGWGKMTKEEEKQFWDRVGKRIDKKDALEESLRSVAASQAELEALTPQQAYQQGEVLIGQHKRKRGQSYLKYAADNGHVEAMHAYALSLYRYSRNSYEAGEYALKAAENGHLGGMVLMIRHSFGSEEEYWRKQLVEAVTDKAEQGDHNAMLLLYYHDSSTWLKKAAQAGNPIAMQILINQLFDNKSITDEERAKELAPLYKAAAETGYPKSISRYAYHVERTQGKEAAIGVWQQLVEMGDANTISRLVYNYSNIENGYSEYAFKGYPKDDFLAAYYAKIYLDTMGIERNSAADYHNALDSYEVLFARLSEQQQQKLLAAVAEYLATHTVRDLTSYDPYLIVFEPYF